MSELRPKTILESINNIVPDIKLYNKSEILKPSNNIRHSFVMEDIYPVPVQVAAAGQVVGTLIYKGALSRGGQIAIGARGTINVAISGITGSEKARGVSLIPFYIVNNMRSENEFKKATNEIGPYGVWQSLDHSSITIEKLMAQSFNNKISTTITASQLPFNEDIILENNVSTYITIREREIFYLGFYFLINGRGSDTTYGPGATYTIRFPEPITIDIYYDVEDALI